MPETVLLGLPLLVAEQAQKHVTHNEALRALDAIVQLSVKDRDLAAPPGSPAEGDRYIVAASPTGVWAAHAADIAVWQDGAWDFHDPREGWRCWVDDENVFLIFNGSAWVDWGAALGALQNLSLLGIGTTADATNPFSAKLNKALWTAKAAAEGGDGDLRYTMNKEAASDVLSLLMQRGFSGRAEIGLIGDDDLLFKVSPDGSSFVEALRMDKTTGKLTHLGQLQFPATQNASSDANCLDDYEEGTFTPTFTAATPPTGVAYSSQVGKYTKIGNVVAIHITLVLTSKGSGGSGTALVGGLPFTSSNAIQPMLAGFCESADLTTNYLQQVAQVVLSSATLRIFELRDAGTANILAWSQIANNSVFLVTGYYYV